MKWLRETYWDNQETHLTKSRRRVREALRELHAEHGTGPRARGASAQESGGEEGTGERGRLGRESRGEEGTGERSRLGHGEQRGAAGADVGWIGRQAT